jgi:hypothetical protein
MLTIDHKDFGGAVRRTPVKPPGGSPENAEQLKIAFRADTGGLHSAET